MFKKEATGTLNRNLYYYIVFWFIYLLFFSVQRYLAMKYVFMSMEMKMPEDAFMGSVITNLIYLPEVIIASHFVVNFLLPRFYFRKKFYMFSLLLALTIILYPLFPYVGRIAIVDVLYPNPEKYSINNYFSAMLIFVFGMAPLAWFRMAVHMRAEEAIRQKIDKDRLEALLKLKEAELKLLKNQIHPHFLFNTLNNLYSLALEKSDRTPDLIIRLSDMLSYIIYDCKSEKVSLTKEVDFIKNYIELQKVRYETCNISFSIKGNLDGREIAPMILHTFIDNSFKHGAEQDPDNPWIKINIGSYEGSLFLTVINSVREEANKEEGNGGIGISNTRKRLALIYRDRHELVFHKSQKKYAVFLKIQL